MRRQWDEWVALFRQHLYAVVFLLVLLFAAVFATGRQLLTEEPAWGEAIFLWLCSLHTSAA